MRVCDSTELINTAEFAEFYGAMLGDGHLTKSIQSLCIAGNGILDKWYVENYLLKISNTLFNRAPRIYKYDYDQTIRFILNSKSIAQLFVEIGFPSGKKNQGLLQIPKMFFEDEKLLTACIRGIFDTDGGIYPHPHTRIMMNMTTKSPTLLKSLQNALNSLDLKYGNTKYQILIYGNKKINEFITKIGSSNPRNIIRYQEFIKQNKVPSAKETESLLKACQYDFQVPYYGPVA